MHLRPIAATICLLLLPVLSSPALAQGSCWSLVNGIETKVLRLALPAGDDAFTGLMTSMLFDPRDGFFNSERAEIEGSRSGNSLSIRLTVGKDTDYPAVIEEAWQVEGETLKPLFDGQPTGAEFRADPARSLDSDCLSAEEQARITGGDNIITAPVGSVPGCNGDEETVMSCVVPGDSLTTLSVCLAGDGATRIRHGNEYALFTEYPGMTEAQDLSWHSLGDDTRIGFNFAVVPITIYDRMEGGSRKAGMTTYSVDGPPEDLACEEGSIQGDGLALLKDRLPQKAFFDAGGLIR